MVNFGLPDVEDVYAVNKTLAERVRADLGMEEDKYATCKSISAEYIYHQGLNNTWEYLSYVEQFGLSHLVLELARLCPDARMQNLLMPGHNANLRSKHLQKDAGSLKGVTFRKRKSEKM